MPVLTSTKEGIIWSKCGYSFWCLQFQGSMFILRLISKYSLKLHLSLLIVTFPLCWQESAVLVSQGIHPQQVNKLPPLCYQHPFWEEGFNKNRVFRRCHTSETTQRFWKKKKQQKNCEQQQSHTELSASTRHVSSRWSRLSELAQGVLLSVYCMVITEDTRVEQYPILLKD